MTYRYLLFIGNDWKFMGAAMLHPHQSSVWHVVRVSLENSDQDCYPRVPPSTLVPVPLLRANTLDSWWWQRVYCQVSLHSIHPQPDEGTGGAFYFPKNEPSDGVYPVVTEPITHSTSKVCMYLRLPLHCCFNATMSLPRIYVLWQHTYIHDNYSPHSAIKKATMLIDMVSSITILKHFEMQNQEEVTVKVTRSYSPTETFPLVQLCAWAGWTPEAHEHISQKVEDYDLIQERTRTGD